MKFNEAIRQYSAEQTDEKLKEIVNALLGEMTLKEKCRMLQGHAMGTTLRGLATKGRFYNCKPYPAGGCKRLGIPPVLFADGPRGIVLGNSTCFPVSMLRGATFDAELEYRAGEAFAKEALAGGANLFAGICINLLRNPMWGRAQETYGEDPCLLGKMGAALTKAVQDKGVIACPKHFALNSVEDLRFSINALSDEKTLREVYLPHFKKCIDAGAMSVMGAYNMVNGSYCCESKELLTDILRDEWHFAGFTLSDFFYGIHSAARSIKAGLDMEMPYLFKYALLGRMVKKGIISEENINISARRILSAMIKIFPRQKKYSKNVILSTEHTALAREIAAKGTVLLKNDKNTLPIPTGKKLAVIGRYANTKNTGDAGSSNVFSPYTVTAYQGIKKRFGGNFVVLYNGTDIKKAAAAAEKCDIIVVCAGCDKNQEGEFLVNIGNVKKKPKGSGGDRESMKLPERDAALIKAMSKLGKRLVVNLTGGSAFIITDWVDCADAVLDSFYSGIEGGSALADILSGDVNPGGRLPFTVAKDENDYPSFPRIGDKCRNTEYGSLVGYTLFDKENKEPLYPFGYGLSYTSFEIISSRIQTDGEKISVSTEVKNTGECDGDIVVQVYVSSLRADADRPVKLLKGFKRLSINKGQTAGTNISIELDDIKFYNPELRAWQLDDEYAFYIGQDSRTLTKIGVVDTRIK